MLLGSGLLGSYPLVSTGFVQSATISTWQQLLANPDADRVHVAVLKPYDPVGDQVVERKYADARWEGDPGDPAAPIRLLEGLDIDGALFSGFAGLSGSAVPTVGGIRVRGNEDQAAGGLDTDELADFTWDGREIEIWMGAPTFPWSEFQPVFVGRALDATWDLDTFTVIARDPEVALKEPIQTNLYLGTGGASPPTGPYPPEGGADLEGKPKPLCYGGSLTYWPNITPVRVDATNHIYQIHDGSIDGVLLVHDQGVQLTMDGDVADVYAWTPVAGHVVTDLANGLFRLGSPPAGQVTAWCRGDNGGPALFINTAADIIDRIVKDKGGLTDDDIDRPALAKFKTEAPQEIFWYSNGTSPQITDVIDELVQGALGYKTYTRLGKLRVGQTRFHNPIRTIREEDVLRIERLRTEPPVWERQQGYARSWTVQGPDELAEGTPPGASIRDYVGYPYRYPTPSQASAVKDDRPLAQSLISDTLFLFEADAITEQTRQLALLKENRDLYEVEVQRHQFALERGETVTLEYPRWGLSSGRLMIVLSVGENTNRRITTLSLWG